MGSLADMPLHEREEAAPAVGDAGDRRPTILILAQYFRPGFEANGPAMSITSMAECLSDRFRFRLLSHASPGEESGRWGRFMGVERLPMKRGLIMPRGLRRTLIETPHDLLLLNSFLDPHFTIPTLLMRRLGLLPRKPIILPPRGEFSPGALSLKAGKKRFYIAFARMLGLLKGVRFLATAKPEADYIKGRLGLTEEVMIAPNVRRLAPLPPHRPRQPSEPLRVAFLGRVVRMKNLNFALEALARVDRPVRFTIFGPIEDAQYWRLCQAQIAQLPGHVEVVQHGQIPPDEVVDRLAAQDLLLHPSLGENFGHAIVDSMLAGTPVLLSDRTPWRDLEKAGVGWDLPLDHPDRFVAALNEAARTTGSAEADRRERTRAYVEQKLDPPGATERLAQCFQAMIAAGRRHDRDEPAVRIGQDRPT